MHFTLVRRTVYPVFIQKRMVAYGHISASFYYRQANIFFTSLSHLIERIQASVAKFWNVSCHSLERTLNLKAYKLYVCTNLIYKGILSDRQLCGCSAICENVSELLFYISLKEIKQMLEEKTFVLKKHFRPHRILVHQQLYFVMNF